MSTLNSIPSKRHMDYWYSIYIMTTDYDANKSYQRMIYCTQVLKPCTIEVEIEMKKT